MSPGIQILCTFVFVVSLVASAIVQKMFIRIDNVDVISSDVTIETNIFSILECASKCVECAVLVYDLASRECRTYGQLNTTLAPSTGLASKTWLSKDVYVFPVQTSTSNPTSVTLEDADQLCTSLGGRLAKSQPDFYNAFLTGLHLCRCGMLDGGIVRFSVQVDDGNCSGATTFPSMPTCKPGGVYMTPTPIAYCAFN